MPPPYGTIMEAQPHTPDTEMSPTLVITPDANNSNSLLRVRPPLNSTDDSPKARLLSSWFSGAFSLRGGAASVDSAPRAVSFILSVAYRKLNEPQ